MSLKKLIEAVRDISTMENDYVVSVKENTTLKNNVTKLEGALMVRVQACQQWQERFSNYKRNKGARHCKNTNIDCLAWLGW